MESVIYKYQLSVSGVDPSPVVWAHLECDVFLLCHLRHFLQQVLESLLSSMGYVVYDLRAQFSDSKLLTC